MAKSYIGMLCCPRCGRETGIVFDKNLQDTLDQSECIADTEPCDECKKELAEIFAIVDQGGVAFTCQGCGGEGAIRLSDSSRKFITTFRKHHFGDREDWETARIGVEFPSCDWHTKFGADDSATTGT